MISAVTYSSVKYDVAVEYQLVTGDNGFGSTKLNGKERPSEGCQCVATAAAAAAAKPDPGKKC